MQSAFKFAVLAHNRNLTTRKFELQAFVDVINTADAFKLSRLGECGKFPSCCSPSYLNCPFNS